MRSSITLLIPTTPRAFFKGFPPGPLVSEGEVYMYLFVRNVYGG